MRKPIPLHYDIYRVAAYLDMSPGYVRAQIKAGQLRALKLGNKVVVDHDSLQEFISRHSTQLPA